jgi:hypothetical protein
LPAEVVVNDAAGPAFELERLKDPAFRFRIEPGDGIAAMRPRVMRFSEPLADGHTLTFSTSGRPKDGDLHAWIERGLNQTHLPLEKLKVASVTIQAILATGNPRPKTVSFTLTARNSCTLKDTPEHQKIREVLRRSEVMCA